MVSKAGGGDVDDAVINDLRDGSRTSYLVSLDGSKIAARALVSNGWWAIAVGVDPNTNAYITGPGDDLPTIDLVTVTSFDELTDQHSG